MFLRISCGASAQEEVHHFLTQSVAFINSLPREDVDLPWFGKSRSSPLVIEGPNDQFASSSNVTVEGREGPPAPSGSGSKLVDLTDAANKLTLEPSVSQPKLPRFNKIKQGDKSEQEEITSVGKWKEREIRKIRSQTAKRDGNGKGKDRITQSHTSEDVAIYRFPRNPSASTSKVNTTRKRQSKTWSKAPFSSIEEDSLVGVLIGEVSLSLRT